VVQAAQSLKTAVQVKYTPSGWHMRYRTMDDLCLSIRTFRQCSNNLSKENLENLENSSSLPQFLETTEDCIISELIVNPETQLAKGLPTETARNALRATGDAVGTAPLGRVNHFFYGVLDLIQQHVQTIDSGKINDKVVNLAFKVAKESSRSFLMCKALEILAAMSLKRGVGLMPTEMVNDLLENNNWDSKKRDKFRDQWFVMRKRAVDMEKYFGGKVMNVLPSPTQVYPFYSPP